MKTRFVMTVAPAAVVGGIILLLGCGAESKKTAASNNGPVVITANAAPQTDDPALPTAPVPPIATAPAKLSPGLEEIVQLAQAGVGDDVLPAYGWCWRPTVAVVDAGWQPYCDRGRWLWTDCGWYWQSDYAWGWAPFHYGRWHRSPAYGWVWLPDTAWAPAWVTWRYSDSYCGWAPLPPGAYFDVGLGFRFHGGRVGLGFDFGLVPDCFTFIPTARFCDRSPWHHRLPPTQVVTIFDRTTIINNYTGGSNNRTVVNIGPGANAIAAVSRSDIRKVTLRDMNPNGGTLIKSERLDGDGRTLAVFRPQLPKQASAPPPEITRRQQALRN